MGAVNSILFNDDDLADLYCADNGRPSLPPSLMSGILLLQFYDDVSDEEAVARLEFDLRWKVALNLPLDFEPPHASSLTVFRGRLLEHKQERYAFNQLIRVGRAAGFLPDKMTMLVDTLAQHGAGAVQDTYTLIRKGIRRVLKAAGYQLPAKKRGLVANLASYLECDHKADIDWADASARAGQLRVLVEDAQATLDIAVTEADDPEVRAAAWLLTKILGDDLTTDEAGNPEIGEGVAPDRIISLTDEEMRHGRKSASRLFDGCKLQVAEEQSSQLIVAIEPVPANAGDGRGMLAVIDQVEEQSGLTVARVIADGAYGAGDNRAGCQAREMDLVSPLAAPADAEVAKANFAIDLQANTVTCPCGHTTTSFKTIKDSQGRATKSFIFDRATCEACPLFPRCVRSKIQGRTVTLHYHEDLLKAARERQHTHEFKVTYKLRAAVERTIAELGGHGAKQARYIGTAKDLLQAQWTGAVVNLKRLFRLFHGDMDHMRAVLMVTANGRAG
jgi:transposase